MIEPRVPFVSLDAISAAARRHPPHRGGQALSLEGTRSARDALVEHSRRQAPHLRARQPRAGGGRRPRARRPSRPLRGAEDPCDEPDRAAPASGARIRRRPLAPVRARSDDRWTPISPPCACSSTERIAARRGIPLKLENWRPSARSAGASTACRSPSSSRRRAAGSSILAALLGRLESVLDALGKVPSTFRSGSARCARPSSGASVC